MLIIKVFFSSITAKRITHKNWMLFFLTFYFLFSVHLVVQNNGGSDGLSLPWVQIGWITSCLLISGVFILLPYDHKIRTTPTFKRLAIGCVVLTLPLLWSPHSDWQMHALPRIAGLWGGLTLYFTFLQCRLTLTQWHRVMLMMAVGAFIQSGFVFAEIFFPDIVPTLSRIITSHELNGYGVFQQRNVTASYLATGLIISLILLIDNRARAAGQKTENLRVMLLVTGIVFTCTTLMLLYSRAGWIGGLLSVILLYILALRFPTPYIMRQRVWIILVLPILGAILGNVLTAFEPNWVTASHASSNTQRWLVIKASLQMIAQHPFIGWGYGGYEYTFQHWAIAQQPPILSHEVMDHPHNEIIYWTVEGGLTALAGIAILFSTGAVLIFRKCTSSRLIHSLCLLPILLHTQLEYPMYESMTHWIIVLLLLVSLDNDNTRVINVTPLYIKIHAQRGLALLALIVAFLLSVVLHNNIVLSDFELRKLKDDNVIIQLPFAWLNEGRYQKDLALLNIIHFQRNNDLSELEEFVVRAHRWSQTYVDADMYENLINTQQFLGLSNQAEHDQKLAALLFLDDIRFPSLIN